MPNYSFAEKDKRYLTLTMSDGNTYDLPLAGSMKVKDLRKLLKMTKLPEDEQFEVQVQFLAQYMGENTVDELTSDELRDIYQLWVKASNGNLEEDGRTLGESLASED